MDPEYGEFDHHFETVAISKCRTILVSFRPEYMYLVVVHVVIVT